MAWAARPVSLLSESAFGSGLPSGNFGNEIMYGSSLITDVMLC
jgi:hypothetical protein